jgi:hypothetical protein
MKKKTKALVIAIIFLLTSLPQLNLFGLGGATALQQPETAWVVWETDAPIQHVALDGK